MANEILCTNQQDIVDALAISASNTDPDPNSKIALRFETDIKNIPFLGITII